MRQVAISIRSYIRAGSGSETNLLEHSSLIMPRNAFEECQWFNSDSLSFQAHTSTANEVAKRADGSVFQERDFPLPPRSKMLVFDKYRSYLFQHCSFTIPGFINCFCRFQEPMIPHECQIAHNVCLRSVFWTWSSRNRLPIEKDSLLKPKPCQVEKWPLW